jgi:hypothetical protein
MQVPVNKPRMMQRTDRISKRFTQVPFFPDSMASFMSKSSGKDSAQQLTTFYRKRYKKRLSFQTKATSLT